MGLRVGGGSGKTTLLKVIQGTTLRDSGSVHFGANVELASVRNTDGGERTKVALTRILTSGANLLLLDEPTNHLEIEAQEALEPALCQFPGAVIVVSHDQLLSGCAWPRSGLLEARWTWPSAVVSGSDELQLKLARQRNATMRHIRFVPAVWLCIWPFASLGQTPQPKLMPSRRGQPPLRRPITRPNENAPIWMNDEGPGIPIDFQAYDGPLPAPASDPCLPYPYICEVRASTADTAANGFYRLRPPMIFPVAASSPPAPETSVYGCNPPGYEPPPAVFTVTQPFYGITGVMTKGNAVGSAINSPAGAYAYVGAYVSSNRCSDNDQEYGFYQNLTNPGEWNFYYAQFTNTSQQITSPLTSITNLRGTPGQDSYFSMYIIPASHADSQAGRTGEPGSDYYFRIQVLTPNSELRTCSINGSRTMPCTVDVAIDTNFWPVSSMVNGPSYLIEFTQASYYVSPTYQQAGTWTVDGAWLGLGMN